MKKIDVVQVRDFIAALSSSTKIYLGADSERVKRNGKWYADYTLAVVVHIDGCHGCKIFGEVQTELDYDHKAMIYYLNTNNGYTILKDGVKIKSIQNRALFFNPQEEHQSTTCTDLKCRMNININYF